MRKLSHHSSPVSGLVINKFHLSPPSTGRREFIGEFYPPLDWKENVGKLSNPGTTRYAIAKFLPIRIEVFSPRNDATGNLRKHVFS
jgi:hypothetical protein